MAPAVGSPYSARDRILLVATGIDCIFWLSNALDVVPFPKVIFQYQLSQANKEELRKYQFYVNRC